MLKQLVRRTLNKAGLDIVRTKHQHGDHAAHLRNLFAAKGVDCVIDVGANVGQYGTFLRKLGFKGHIVSFEPVPGAFAGLEKARAGDPKWSAHRLALGDKAEERTMNVYSGSGQFSSFLRANDYAKGIWSSLSDVEERSMPIRRLDAVYDELVAPLGCERVMLKLDTQGFDRQAFEGARGILPKVVALQSELSLIPVYEGAPTGYDLLNDFHREGFFVSGMYPINREPSLAVIEFDCVLVRRDAPA